MKKLLLAGVAFAGLVAGAGVASAADLPRRAAPPPPVFAAPVPVFTWTGFYVGLNAGAGWSNNDDNGTFIPGVGFVDLGNNDDDVGFVGGGQIGYNFQFGTFVLGVEADLQWADFGNDNDIFVDNTVISFGNNLDWFGTVRARAGVAFDRALIYVTGGFAFADTGNNNGFFNNDDDWSTGWTIGAGVEYAFTNNLTLGVEGLWVNLDRGDSVALVNGTPVVLNSDDDDFFVARAKLNFKF